VEKFLKSFTEVRVARKTAESVTFSQPIANMQLEFNVHKAQGVQVH
jgi:hypothetical protein